MINIRIPTEIRNYKERLILGLTIRQFFSTALAVMLCVPLYFYGKKYLPEDVVAWGVILIAAPLAAIGFVKLNGLPFEKIAVAIARWFMAPSKRKYVTSNIFRENNEAALYYERPATNRGKKKLAKYKQQAAWEKIVLMQEAEERGDMSMNVDEQELLTVRKPNIKYPVDEFALKQELVSKDATLKMSKGQRKLMLNGESIENKMKNNPRYVMTTPEEKTMRKYRQLIETLRVKQVNQKKAEASKTNKVLKKRRTAKYTIPRVTADSIPIVATYDEGVFEVAPNKYSKQFRIQDINYRTAKQEIQDEVFIKLCEFYNSFNEQVHFAITIDNCIVSMEEQERRVLYKETGDPVYDKHRKEYNRILKQQLSMGRNDIQLEKFLTITIDADEPMEALLRFRRVSADIVDKFEKIGKTGDNGNKGAKLIPMTTTERLSYFHDKLRAGHEGEFSIDYDFLKQQGLSCKDYIAPPSFDFGHTKYFQMGDTYYRAVYISKLAKSLNDEFLYELYSCEFPITITMNVQAVDPERGMTIVRRQLTGIEGDKQRAEQKAVLHNYSPDNIRHDIKDAHEQALQLYDDLQNKDQKLFMVTFTILVQGNSLDEVNQNVQTLEGKAAAYTCQIMALPYQQEEAFKTTLPFGYVSKSLAIDRALTTESSAIFVPFSNLEMFQTGGIPCGQNAISKNMVVVDRLQMKSPSGFIIGTTGSGKSFAMKREILNILLHDNESNMIVIDPENEYSDFCRAFGGTVIKLSDYSESHLNPMEMAEEYGLDDEDYELKNGILTVKESVTMEMKKEKAIKKKSEFIMSIIERMISISDNPDESGITPVQKTIVDRCVKRCYNNYLENNFNKAYVPTLIDLQNEFNHEKELEAKQGYKGEATQIAESVEYYTTGSMDTFAQKSNVDLNNRLICFKVRDLGKQLEQVAYTIVFDFIWNKMIENKNKLIRTYCCVDEIHVMFESYYSARFLKQLYKRGRKYGLVITGVTQNVTDLMNSTEARGMINNSDFVMMLNQKAEDMMILSQLLSISDTLKSYATNVDEGCGLLYAERAIIPFVDKFPSDSYLYRLMSTKFGEDMTQSEADELIQKIMQSA